MSIEKFPITNPNGIAYWQDRSFILLAEKINEVIDALNRMEAELYLSKEMSDQILKVMLEKDHP